MISPNTILQDRYRVVREVGHGGMGAVYEVIDQRARRSLAILAALFALVWGVSTLNVLANAGQGPGGEIKPKRDRQSEGSAIRTSRDCRKLTE